MFEDASVPDGAGRVVPVEPLEIPAEPPVVLSGAVLALREAVRAFKAGQSLTSLVGVATFLDDRGLLAW